MIFIYFFIIFCDILKIPLTSILIYKLLLLFICLFNAYVFEVSYNKNLIVYCLLESSISENLVDRREPGICVSAVLKRLCAIFYPCFIQNSSNFDTNIIETWHNIYLRFPKVKDEKITTSKKKFLCTKFNANEIYTTEVPHGVIA